MAEVSFWTIAGERQSGRIRARYLESLLRQEVALYDTEMTTGEIVHQISSDSLLIHEAMGEKVSELSLLSRDLEQPFKSPQRAGRSFWKVWGPANSKLEADSNLMMRLRGPTGASVCRLRAFSTTYQPS